MLTKKKRERRIINTGREGEGKKKSRVRQYREYPGGA